MGGNSREGKTIKDHRDCAQTDPGFHCKVVKPSLSKHPRRKRKIWMRTRLHTEKSRRLVRCLALCRRGRWLIHAARREGAERNGREGEGKRAAECRTARHQEIREEIVDLMTCVWRQGATAS